MPVSKLATSPRRPSHITQLLFFEVETHRADVPAAAVNITVKSLKPSLSLPISVNVTDSVSQLKAAISQLSSSAPNPDSQRLLLKGKALTDSKLLKEYDITDGSIVHLYLKPAAGAASGSASTSTSAAESATTTAPATSISTAPVGEASRSSPSPPSPAPPALTITTDVDDDGPGTSMPLTNFDLAAPPTGPQPEVTSATFHNTIADPTFWQKIHALCVSEFEHGDEADLTWEHFLRAMKGKLSAGEAAKIRDVVGVRGEDVSKLVTRIRGRS